MNNFITRLIFAFYIIFYIYLFFYLVRTNFTFSSVVYFYLFYDLITFILLLNFRLMKTAVRNIPLAYFNWTITNHIIMYYITYYLLVYLSFHVVFFILRKIRTWPWFIILNNFNLRLLYLYLRSVILNYDITVFWTAFTHFLSSLRDDLDFYSLRSILTFPSFPMRDILAESEI